MTAETPGQGVRTGGDGDDREACPLPFTAIRLTGYR